MISSDDEKAGFGVMLACADLLPSFIPILAAKMGLRCVFSLVESYK